MFRAVKALCALMLLLLSTNVFASHLSDAKTMYSQLRLSHEVSYDKFEKAYNHFRTHRGNSSVFTLIDYSKPSSQKRFWVFDAAKRKTLYSSYVSHGKNSGNLYAKTFSNRVNSHQTSIGVFRAGETYYGKHGYSLRLDGLSKGINDNARKRAIVIHGAAYAHPKVISKTGQLGRSWGCPALPSYLSKKVINTIKDGTYIYAFG
ncbi:murein L,D-transpeptidase catalytic domain family protein [Enterovibrio makurazakiensis]|uniref:Murein L,D-transpeptidase catalytic domain family protein n=1 Tax=Enterovibrio gelatinilyticus TaxID=2899819 RepID=A0ABT5QU97_9GAMM|nr:murein L,D-transpeptidase catalytic domain family protein [Enterovibrio sp. ZSDZ42]MDD1791571.1 murein L,D-transpeptidase catalytic domain family protein [Enterovibrio sp. ZSDZ42]